MLWKEYLGRYPGGDGYSQFCYRWAVYVKQKDVAMHLEYKPGAIIMIDFAGKKLSYMDKETVEMIACEVFVSCLPFSGLIFCKAVRSQKSDDFLLCTSMLYSVIMEEFSPLS